MKKTPSKEEIISQSIKFHLEGNILEATKYYQYCINQGFGDHRVFSNYGSILKNLGKSQEAVSSYRKAIKLNPDFAIAHSNLGTVLRDLGKLQEAEFSYRKAIKLDPDFANAHCNLGSVLIDLGKFKEAESYTRKAIKLNPDSDSALSNLGLILQEFDKLQEAEFVCRKAIELNPNFANAHSNLGNILVKLDKLKEAESSYCNAIKFNPDFAAAHYNLGNVLSALGKFNEAEFSYRKAIQLNPGYANAHSNLGTILSKLGKLQEAASSFRKAIKLNPDFAIAHSNLGTVLRDLGKLEEAEFSYLTAIKLNPDLAIAYFSLSTLQISNNNKIWREKLFSKHFLNNKLEKDKVNLCFARANILHRESNFRESSKYLLLSNNLELNLNPTNCGDLLNRSKELLLESNNEVINNNQHSNISESIFIVGMPRSGSTLLESILSMNENVDDLGEKNIFEESFLQWKNPLQKSTLREIYLKKTNTYSNELRTTTNKWLYNYQYTGIISTQIPNSKIIHCFRNPLDNILSIFRTNFGEGNQYSSSLIDCAKVYLDQEEVMTQYKKRFRSKIYDLNYDSLVRNPSLEIKSLISWLGWNWDNKYLSPHLNPRSVSTASSVQVRSPINSKSIEGWKNYKEMLKPAMEIITQNNKYKNLKY